METPTLELRWGRQRFQQPNLAQKEDDGRFMPEITDFKAVDKLDAKLFEQP